MARKPAPGTRQRILAVAARLFGEHGVRSVGMQRLVSETGLGKNLVYREFEGKDHLVAEWLRDSHADWSLSVETVIQRYRDDPSRQLLAIVEFYYDSVVNTAFHGCPFYCTLSEFRDHSHPGRQAAVAHLESVRQLFRTLAGAAGAADPGRLADALMLISQHCDRDAMAGTGLKRQGVPPIRAAIPLST
jgi:AcrR family transcriptional regulator